MFRNIICQSFKIGSVLWSSIKFFIKTGSFRFFWTSELIIYRIISVKLFLFIVCHLFSRCPSLSFLHHLSQQSVRGCSCLWNSEVDLLHLSLSPHCLLPGVSNSDQWVNEQLMKMKVWRWTDSADDLLPGLILTCWRTKRVQEEESAASENN